MYIYELSKEWQGFGQRWEQIETRLYHAASILSSRTQPTVVNTGVPAELLSLQNAQAETQFGN